METFVLSAIVHTNHGPHSLGTLIEWKRYTTNKSSELRILSPHSLGTLIEWKQNSTSCANNPAVISCPHSLGTLIEWKRYPTLALNYPIRVSPHSLGTLIEWKLVVSHQSAVLGLPSPLAGDIN